MVRGVVMEVAIDKYIIMVFLCGTAVCHYSG